MDLRPPMDPAPRHDPVRPVIHVVDDDPDMIALVKAYLDDAGFAVTGFANARQAIEGVRAEAPDAIIVDLVMPGLSGMDLLTVLREHHPSVPVLVMTGDQSAGVAEEAFAAGASDFIAKPFAGADLVARLRRVIELAAASALLKRAEQRASSDIVGSHPRTQAVRDFVLQVAGVPRVTALLLGETGTGKNLVARLLHHESDAARFKFVEVNCAALPEHLLEAELFGYERGAFTDAREAKKGLVEVADRGTLFLDEVGTLPPQLQAKLLSFLESRVFRRLGSTKERQADVRVLAATNADIESDARAGRFREDLLYRLNVAQIVLPSLREIRSDIPDLAQHFLDRAVGYFGRPKSQIARECVPALQAYPWPGNARELRNAVERALTFSKGPTLHVQPPRSAASAVPAANAPSAAPDGLVIPRGLTLEEVERRYILDTIDDADGRLEVAARRLGVTRKVLWARRKKLGLLRPEEEG